MLPDTQRWIPGFQGRYAASRDGVIVSYVLKSGEALAPSEREGYHCVVLFDAEGHDSFRSVHRLVYETWVSPDIRGLHIHHLNHCKTDNRVSNLSSLTPSEHSKLHGSDRPKHFVLLECPVCGVEFERERRQTHLVKRANKASYCSRSCAGKNYGKHQRYPAQVLREYYKTGP